jgi:hypothetical protein
VWPHPRMNWEKLVPRLIHPTKVIVIEAMLWIERPLSATELQNIANGTPVISSFSYHLDRLVESGALDVVTKLKARRSQGSKREKFFYFVGERHWASRLARIKDPNDPLMMVALSFGVTALAGGGPDAGVS